MGIYCCDGFFRWLRRPGDTEEDGRHRRLLFTVAVFVVTMSGVAVISRRGNPGMYVAGAWLLFVPSSICLMHIVLRMRGSYATVFSCLALPGSMGVLVIDVANASTGQSTRLWPCLVLIMDLLVVVNSTLRVQVVIVVSTVFYFAVLSVEGATSFGLFHVAKNGNTQQGYCSCENPPCAISVTTGILNWTVASCVFVLDFFITRGFATGLRAQTTINGTTVTVAELVAKLLADYAIDEARGVVAADGEQLSEPLRAAFGKLLDNLERYRAFLPAGLLAGDDVPYQSVIRNTEDDCAQVVPQLAVQQMRRAAENVFLQAARQCREEATQTMTEVLHACIRVGDTEGAQRLLRLGWDAPTDLAEQAQLVAAPHVLGGATVSSILLPSSPVERHQRQHRLSIHTATSCSVAGLQGTMGRFGDGAEDPAGCLVAAPLWPEGYTPTSPLDSVHSMADWHEVTGARHWPGEAVEQLIGDYRTLYGGTDPGWIMMPLYVYTIEFHHTIVWASWQGGRWRSCENLDHFVEQEARSLQLSGDLRHRLGLCPTSYLSGAAELLAESPHGLRVYGVEGEPRLLRYENSCCGDPEASPLNDTVLWAAGPERLTAPGLMFSAVEQTPVPPGILEFITSRDFGGSYSGRDWESSPLDLFSGIHEQCMAQKNQQRPKESLCRLAIKAFNSAPSELEGHRLSGDQLAAVLPVLYQAKCPSSTPSPAQIAHACELGLLRWQRSFALVAFTGEPRIAVPLSDGAPGAVQLWRVDNAYWPAQPYLLLNSAMRSQQLGDRDACLTASSSPLPFYASQPDSPPAVPRAAVFRNAVGTAQWGGTDWVLSLAECFDLIHSEGEVAAQAWGLPQFRALIWHINANLEELLRRQGVAARVKGYRGLQGVTLDRSVYARGMVVLFPAFTSTSGDQGVAAGFAQGEGAAVVFTTYTNSGCCISQWSRFGREKEVLLRPNTLHLVTDALSAEHAAIVDKEALQVFDLKEMSPAEATRHLAKEGALAISGEHPNMLQQAARAAASAAAGDWLSALRELLTTPADAAAGGGEGRFVRAVLPKTSVGIIVLVLSSPEGYEIGAAIDPWVWNGFFEQAEAKARGCNAQLITTSLGHIMATITHADGPEASAQAAVELALELCDPAAERSPQRRRTLGAASLSASQRSATASRELALQVHCGVSVGTVHSGFGGSAQRRVEIADGPAVRRAFRMAAYSQRHGVREVITDSACAAAAAAAQHTTWTLDLVSFDSQRDLREPITCVEAPGRPGAMGAAAALSIKAAWDAVEAAANGSQGAAQTVQERVDSLPPGTSAHRAARALRDAAAQPSTYCYDLEGGH